MAHWADGRAGQRIRRAGPVGYQIRKKNGLTQSQQSQQSFLVLVPPPCEAKRFAGSTPPSRYSLFPIPYSLTLAFNLRTSRPQLRVP
jgi:hypothetical protein